MSQVIVENVKIKRMNMVRGPWCSPFGSAQGRLLRKSRRVRPPHSWWRKNRPAPHRKPSCRPHRAHPWQGTPRMGQPPRWRRKGGPAPFPPLEPGGRLPTSSPSRTQPASAVTCVLLSRTVTIFHVSVLGCTPPVCPRILPVPGFSYMYDFSSQVYPLWMEIFEAELNNV